MKRYNPVIQSQKERKQENMRRTEICIQMCFDSATLAAHDVFKLGPGRYIAFVNAFRQYINEIGAMIHEDAKSDVDFEYARAKIDEAIKAVAGEENFQPWDERYGYNESK